MAVNFKLAKLKMKEKMSNGRLIKYIGLLSV